MSTYAVTDAATMLRRDFLHLRRYPIMTISGIGTPTVMLLLFVFVFGGAMRSSLGVGASYINYLVPGILMMTLGSGCAATAIGINNDKTKGILARFRIMRTSLASVLPGRLVSTLV